MVVREKEAMFMNTFLIPIFSIISKISGNKYLIVLYYSLIKITIVLYHPLSSILFSYKKY